MTMVTDGVTFLPGHSTSEPVTVALGLVECNCTQNTSSDPFGATAQSSDVASLMGDVVAALIAVLLSAVIIGTLLGNASVILAVTVYDKMRTLSNALIASLGSADLLVAIVVMPISLQVR